MKEFISNLTQNLPEDLTDNIKSWVAWKEVNILGKKPQKVSYSVYDGKTFKGSLNDPDNAMRFASFDEAIDELEAGKLGRWDGLGIMFTNNGFVGIDVDRCILDGKFSDTALEILEHFKGGYAEYSPSGEGFHVLTKGVLSDNFNNNDAGVEAYSRDRFFTVTGNPLKKGREIIENQPGIDWLFAKYGKPTKKEMDSGELSDAAKMVIDALVESGATVAKTDGNKAYIQRPGGTRQSGNVLLDTGQFYCHTNSWFPFAACEGYGPKRVLTMLGKNKPSSHRLQSLSPGKGRVMSDLNKMFEAKTKWIWKQHIPEGEPSIVNGREGSGKTTICLQMSKEMLSEYPDHVIYWLATEGAVKNTVIHANALGITSQRFMIAQKTDGSFLFDFRVKGDMAVMAAMLEASEKPILAVFVDSIRGSTGCEDNESRTGALMHRVNAIVCDKHRASLIYIHHMGKGKKESLLDRSVGSTAITAAVRHVLSVEQRSKYKREIKCAKSNIDNSPVLECIKLGNRIEIFEPSQLSEESQVDRGEKLLSELFAEREQIPAYEIYRAGEEIGVLDTSLKRAKDRLGIESVRNGKTWDWVLSLGGNGLLTPLNFSDANYPKLLGRQESKSRVQQESKAKSVKSVKGVKGNFENTLDSSLHPSNNNNKNKNIQDIKTVNLENPIGGVEKCAGCKANGKDGNCYSYAVFEHKHGKPEPLEMAIFSCER